MEWTKEQQRIINIKGSNILVSAAAGSGKTAVLVERIIKLIKDEKEDIDKFLVVTFTNAAAEGMKQKIQKALVKAAQEEGDLRHIRRQLSLLNKAQITTIHSFCLDIVRKNFHLIGIDPNFRIGDTSELNILLQESIDEVLEKHYTNLSENFKLLVESYNNNRGDQELSNILIRVYNFILSFPDPIKWLVESVNALDLSKDEFLDTLWYKEIVKSIGLQLNGAKEVLNLGIKICEEPDGPSVYKATLLEDIAIVDELISALRLDLISFVKALNDFKAPRIKSINKKDPSSELINPEKQEEVKETIRNEYKEILKSINAFLPYNDLESYIDDIKYMYAPISQLKELIKEIDQVYSNKKLDRQLADFNDLEHYALRILKNNDISELYRSKFSYIFVDEYQDSNSIQEAIVEHIKRHNNLFMVGDVKQSIYRFRLADPGIFNMKYNTFTLDKDDLSEDVVDRVIELNKNFRSRGEVLDATNLVFKNIMSKDLGEIDYNENVYLQCGNIFPNNAPVELNLIDKNSLYDDRTDEEDSEQLDEEIGAMENAQLEAQFAVNKIRNIIGTKTYDVNSEEKLRDIEYSDIVILMRSVSAWASIFEEVFNREGIPFYFDGGSGYFETIEVQVMINLLRLIDNIRQDIPLLSVMRSPIGGFTTDELVMIRTNSQKSSYSSACLKYIEDNKERQDNLLLEKLNGFFEKVNNWTKRSRYSHLNELIWEILMETNYYNFVGALPNGKMRQANLRLLCDKAYDFEKTSMTGLFKFLTYIEKINSSQDKSSTAKTLGENDNVVRLMSIHKSKGLEFPVVILCGLNKMFNKEDTRSQIMLHKEYGLGAKYINPIERYENNTLSRLAISNKLKLEALSEEMRILYVAMTRAIDRLIMVGTITSIDKKVKVWRKGYSRYFLSKGSSYLDWIGSCLFSGLNTEEVIDLLSKGNCMDWNIHRCSITDILNDNIIENKIDPNGRIKELESYQDKQRYDEISRILGFKYPYRNSIKIPTKLSVTDTKNLREENLSRLRYRIPTLSSSIQFNKDNNKLIVNKNTLSGAEIGSLIHIVMQHLDVYDKVDSESLLNQINDMRVKNIISEEEEIYIINNFLGKVEGFLLSDIGIRLRKSPIVKREVPFVIKKKVSELLGSLSEDDFILIQGIIDCYFMEDDEIVLIDYKTDAVKDSEVEIIKAEYKDQIYSYRDALEKLTNKRVKESYLYLFSLGKALKID